MKSISLTETAESLGVTCPLHEEKVLPLPSNLSYELLIGPQHFYVVFRESEHDFLGKRWLKKGFSHCTVVQRHEFGWVMLNPTRAHLHIDIMDFLPHEEAMLLLKQEYPDIKIVEVLVHIDEKVDQFFNPITCVAMSNYMLGLNWPALTCMTPYQLYKKLLKAEHPNIIRAKEVS